MENKINKALEILNDKYYEFINMDLLEYNKLMNKNFGKLMINRGYGYKLPISMNTWILSDENMELLSDRINVLSNDINKDLDSYEMCYLYESEIQKLGGGYFEDLIFKDDKIIGLEDSAFNFCYKEYLESL